MARVDTLTLFDASIRMQGKPAFVPRVDGVAGAPLPTAKLCPAVVREGLVDFCLGVHHKRSVLRNRLAYRAALQ